MTRKSTMVELVEELRLLKPSEQINFMIQEALAGEYHDYKNEKYACGKMASSQRLRYLGKPEHIALAERIEQGEFDEECDADDRAMMSADLFDNMPKAQAEGMEEILGLKEPTKH